MFKFILDVGREFHTFGYGEPTRSALC